MTSITDPENGTHTDTAASLLGSQALLPNPPRLSHEFAAPAKRRLLSRAQVIALALAAIWGSSGIYLIFASYLSRHDAVVANGALGTIQTAIRATPASPAGDVYPLTQREPTPDSGLTPKELQMHQAATLLEVASQLANATRRAEIVSALAQQSHNLKND